MEAKAHYTLSQGSKLQMPLLQDKDGPINNTLQNEDIEIHQPQEKRTPWYAYPILILCGASGAMDGPFSQFLTTRNPFLRMSWKFQGVLFLLIIYAALLFAFRLITRQSNLNSKGIQKSDIVTLLLTAIGLIGMQSFLTWGATYTIMSHANLYSSLCAIMIVGWRLVAKAPVSNAEFVGSFVALSGCLVTTFDPSAEKTLDQDNKIQLGNLLSFFSSIFATVYILKGQELSSRVHALPYLLSVTGISCLIFYTVIPLAYQGDNFHYTMDNDTGLFGWLSKENFTYNLFVVSGLNGVGTLTLQMLVFRYFTPVVAGTMMLLEPLFSQIYGIALGLDEYPGVVTYFGGVLILGGLFMLLVYEDKTEQAKKVSIQ
ncbi:hypothetical protein FGO68_gene15410 [Halteria grandinella]|uniref:EamA domain-containing protein n=1 Tax=Halteria grandinella TaxID=5974 RepID=A0A8J8NMI6_HALGN|nr:hypothetical protein FGO68_gene15410 [Halteria grandinella]